MMKGKKTRMRPKALPVQDQVTLAHGSGGSRMHELIERMRRPLANPVLDQMADAALLKLDGNQAVFSTDSFVVRPLFFPGGDIGRLAVCGTVNDLAMRGARPRYLSLALILEEGLAFSLLDRVVASIAQTAAQAQVTVVTGDLKVVEKGSADGIFINTSGIGLVERGFRNVGTRAQKGDLVIINGPVAEHGMAVLQAREGLGFETRIRSDCCPLYDQVRRCLKASRRIRVMRDPTRGGLATACGEIARASGLGVEIEEDAVPVSRAVRTFCDVLGFDPLYVANEGKFLCFVHPDDAKGLCRALGPRARVIGRVVGRHPGEAVLNTRVGSSRLLPLLDADPLPRIC